VGGCPVVACTGIGGAYSAKPRDTRAWRPAKSTGIGASAWRYGKLGPDVRLAGRAGPGHRKIARIRVGIFPEEWVSAFEQP
jgi:hypothetical protein